MRLHWGLGSWSNPHFDHGLYHLRTPHAERPGLYAQRFDCLEVDVMHHQEVAEDDVARWIEAVPPSFRFLPKLHKAITHGAYGDDEIEEARRKLPDLAAFGGRLGPVLAQFPKSFEASTENRAWLDRLLQVLPRPVAVEFRHPSWWQEETRMALTAAGACLVWNTMPRLEAPPWATTDWGYVRFVGTAGKKRGRWVQSRTRTAELLDIRRRIQDAPWKEAFVIVTNRFEGNALDSLPRVAAALAGPEEGRRFLHGPGQPLCT